MFNTDYENDKEFLSLIDTYLCEEKVQCLKNIPHHDTNRLEHCLRVSYLSYKMCKRLNLNYISAAKAGLLHDFYFNRINDMTNARDKVKLFMNEHPEDAVKNAESCFFMTPLEKDIIISHMWPVSKHMPKHRESFVVSFADKVSSFSEFPVRSKYSLSQAVGVCFIMLTNFLFK